MEESPTPPEEALPARWRTITLIGLSASAAWAIWSTSGPWWLLGVIVAGAAAGAVALGLWNPGPLRKLDERSPRSVWLLPRLVLIAVAVTLIAAPYPTPSTSSLECPAESGLEDSGVLNYARLNDTTLVCVYRYTGMGLEL